MRRVALGELAAGGVLLGVLGAAAIALGSACAGGESKSTGGATGATTGAGGEGGASMSSGAGGATGGGGTGGSGPPPPTVDCSPPAGPEGPLKLTLIAAGLAYPVQVKAAPGDPSRLFIVSQHGQIHVIRDGVLLPAPFLDIDPLVMNVSEGNERGLLGLAFHPNYEENGRFFLHYTDASTPSGDTMIGEFKRGSGPDTADPTPVATVLTQVQPSPNHNGGSIEFSPVDGFLYIGLGDGGGANSYGNGQDLGTLLGKILRIDVTRLPYAIPPGNMTGSGVLGEIWDYGLRNPWRFSFDACLSDLYIGDVGLASWEEINVEPAGQGGKNYGWSLMEGKHCYMPPDCDMTGLTLPVAEHDHTQGCSVTGGYVYRGIAIPWLRGAYLYSDYCGGKIWALRYENGMASTPVDLTADLQSLGLYVSSFGQDYDGEIYVVDRLGGRVFRIDPE